MRRSKSLWVIARTSGESRSTRIASNCSRDAAKGFFSTASACACMVAGPLGLVGYRFRHLIPTPVGPSCQLLHDVNLPELHCSGAAREDLHPITSWCGLSTAQTSSSTVIEEPEP